MAAAQKPSSASPPTGGVEEAVAPSCNGPPPPPLQNKRAEKTFKRFFEQYTWGSAEKPRAEGPEQRSELWRQIKRLRDSKKDLKHGNPKRAEADRLLAIMREKAKDAAKREGRYTKKAMAVDEAAAQLEQCDKVQEVLQAKLTKLAKSMLKNVKELCNLQEVQHCQHQATATAGHSVVQVANELLAGGDPDEPMDEPVEVHAPSCIKKGEQDKATQNKASKVAKAGKYKTCQKKEGILKSASIPKRPRRPPATTG